MKVHLRFEPEAYRQQSSGRPSTSSENRKCFDSFSRALKQTKFMLAEIPTQCVRNFRNSYSCVGFPVLWSSAVDLLNEVRDHGIHAKFRTGLLKSNVSGIFCIIYGHASNVENNHGILTDVVKVVAGLHSLSKIMSARRRNIILSVKRENSFRKRARCNLHPVHSLFSVRANSNCFGW